MNKVIVTTTINPVREALEKYDQMKGWTLVVAGDKKTPLDFKLKNGIYISPQDQVRMNEKLSDLIGWNTIRRRNFAFLKAKELNADIIATIDDDNIPLDNWGQTLLLGKRVEVREYSTKLPVFDPVGAAGYPHLWHRGFPLQLLRERSYTEPKPTWIEPQIQANFWNGDPDIDAICRMEHAPECRFDPKHFPFSCRTLSPFNSQNTIFTRAVLPHYYMFTEVGRMDDIWAAYYVEALGFKVVYGEATVYQQRNPQDLTKNMEDEYLGYSKNPRLIDALYKNPKALAQFLPERSVLAFREYQREFDELSAPGL